MWIFNNLSTKLLEPHSIHISSPKYKKNILCHVPFNTNHGKNIGARISRVSAPLINFRPFQRVYKGKLKTTMLDKTSQAKAQINPPNSWKTNSRAVDMLTGEALRSIKRFRQNHTLMVITKLLQDIFFKWPLQRKFLLLCTLQSLHSVWRI